MPDSGRVERNRRLRVSPATGSAGEREKAGRQKTGKYLYGIAIREQQKIRKHGSEVSIMPVIGRPARSGKTGKSRTTDNAHYVKARFTAVRRGGG